VQQIVYVPAFEELRKPVLRKTVARITTPQQAVAIGDLNVEDLTNRLRSEVEHGHFADETAAAYTTERPAGFRRDGL
jgi:hypothetical protein